MRWKTPSRFTSRCFNAAAMWRATRAVIRHARLKCTALHNSFRAGASQPQCGSVKPKYLIGYLVNDEPR